MAKAQGKNAAVDAIDDGMRENMIAVNRVTKVVKGGRIMALTVRSTTLWKLIMVLPALCCFPPLKVPVSSPVARCALCLMLWAFAILLPRLTAPRIRTTWFVQR